MSSVPAYETHPSVPAPGLHIKTRQQIAARSRAVVFSLVVGIAGVWWYAAHSSGWVANAYLWATSPVRSAVGYGARAVQAPFAVFGERARREEETARLREEVRRLSEDAALHEAARNEMAALRAMGGEEAEANPLSARRTLARVVGKGSHVFGQEILLNKGLEAGIARGDTVVLGARTLVGVVTEVTPSFSRVELVGNRAFRAASRVVAWAPEAISDDVAGVAASATAGEGVVMPLRPRPARAPEPGPEGLVRGEGFGDAVLDMVPASATLREGDLIVTSGADAAFLPDLLIGRVGPLRSGPADFFQRADVVPAADLGEVSIVSLLPYPVSVE